MGRDGSPPTPSRLDLCRPLHNGADRIDQTTRGTMGKLVLEISISLDGFVAGPDQTLEAPLSQSGELLHEWAIATASFRRVHGMTGGQASRDSAIVEETADPPRSVKTGLRRAIAEPASCRRARRQIERAAAQAEKPVRPIVGWGHSRSQSPSFKPGGARMRALPLVPRETRWRPWPLRPVDDRLGGIRVVQVVKRGEMRWSVSVIATRSSVLG